MIGIVLPLLAAGAQAAELKVYASTAVKAALEELGPQFEKAAGDKLVFTFGLTAAVKKQIDEGAAFDVVILTQTLTNDLATAGKIDPASRVAIARVGSGSRCPPARRSPMSARLKRSGGRSCGQNRSASPASASAAPATKPYWPSLASPIK